MKHTKRCLDAVFPVRRLHMARLGGLLLAAVLALASAVRAEDAVPDAGTSGGGDAIEALSALSLEELRAEEQATMTQIEETARQAGVLKEDIWNARRAARRHDERVAVLNKELDEVKQRIERAIDEAPGVAEKTTEFDEAQQRLLELGRKRQALMTLIAAKDAPARPAVPGATQEALSITTP
jgi:hypothetical protein